MTAPMGPMTRPTVPPGPAAPAPRLPMAPAPMAGAEMATCPKCGFQFDAEAGGPGLPPGPTPPAGGDVKQWFEQSSPEMALRRPPGP
jgi:hypothetical protein